MYNLELKTIGEDGEWYLATRELVTKYLVGVPGVQLLKYSEICRSERRFVFKIHRSHLPLLPYDLQNHRLMRESPGSTVEFDRMTGRLGWKLRPYQHVAKDFIRARRGTLLALQQRLGKTATVVAAHREEDGQLVVVGPLAARAVWKGWLKRRWPNLELAIIEGRKYDRAKLQEAPLVFIHYDLLRSWAQVDRMNIGTLVFDEAHKLSSRRSQVTQAAYLLAGQAGRVILSTGTPVWNRPSGLYPLLAIMTPGAWGSFTNFGKRYADGKLGAYGWIWDGVSNESEFKKRLEEIMIRRAWKDTVEDLPSLTRVVKLVTVSDIESLEIDKLAEASRDAINTNRTTVGEIARLRKFLGKLKMANAVEEAKSFMENSESVVVWCWHKDIAERISYNLKAYLITGDTSISDRERVLDRWREDSKSTLVLTIGAGQTAIDLSHAHHSIFVEQSWTPTEVSQAEMRTFSPDHPMSVTHLVTDHPIDRMISLTLLKKLQKSERLGLPSADTDLGVLGSAFGDDESFWGRVFE